MQLSVSRIDIYADFEGWRLVADDRHRFSCRSASVRTFEDDGRLTGFEFGRRSTKTVSARIYDKMSPATLDEHEADTFREHVFMNVLSP